MLYTLSKFICTCACIMVYDHDPDSTHIQQDALDNTPSQHSCLLRAATSAISQVRPTSCSIVLLKLIMANLVLSCTLEPLSTMLDVVCAGDPFLCVCVLLCYVFTQPVIAESYLSQLAAVFQANSATH